MDRNELILSCSGLVNNLVKKYNNHQPDEDLQSVGMIAVIKCVDRCLKENMDDINQIQARCNIWAKNSILNEIYKEKIKIDDDENALLNYEDDEDLSELLMNVRQTLTPQQLKIFDMLYYGYTREEIMTKLNIGKSMFYRHLAKIREKIVEK